MTERYWARPDWIRWLNVPSVPLDVAASLSLGFEPQSTQKITWDENGGKTVKWFHPAHTTNEGSDRLSRLRDFFNTEHLPAYEVPALPGHRPEERIRLLDLVRFAVAQDWDIPLKLTKLLPVEPSTPSVVQAAALPGPAPVAVVAENASLTHSTKARRDALTPVIELAQEKCRNPKDTAEVWAALAVLAEKKHPPLLGATEDGLQYLNSGAAAIFKRDSLRKRLGR